MSAKYCVNCKHFQPAMQFISESMQITYATCAAQPRADAIDLVTGKAKDPNKAFYYCDITRETDLKDRCGREARFYEHSCDTCGGSGFHSVSYGGDGYGGRCAGLADADDQPCPECNEDYSRVTVAP